MFGGDTFHMHNETESRIIIDKHLHGIFSSGIF